LGSHGGKHGREPSCRLFRLFNPPDWTGIDDRRYLAQAQRRFRERQKTKFTELTGKVEELEGRLGELLSEKARLEDRTTILEHTLEMRRATSGETDDSLARHLSSVVCASALPLACSPLLHCCIGGRLI
jgi:hypothetical protein